MTKVKLGYLLPTREKIMSGVQATKPIINLARRAETLGYDSIWIGDSVTAKPRHDAFVILAGIAAATERVELGTAVLLPMLRNPVLLAHQAATLDQLSEGRLILGVGTARDVPAIRKEFEAVGVSFEKRIGRMLEGLDLAKALWAGGPVSWEGRWTTDAVEIGPLPFRLGGPPIWGGGAAEGALKRAGRYFDGWFPSGPSDPNVFTEGLKRVRGYADAAGRNPDHVTPAMYVTVSINSDAQKAEADLNSYLEAYYLQPASKLRQQQAAFSGSETQVGEWLARFIEAGCSHICIRPVGETEEQMERIIGLWSSIGG